MAKKILPLFYDVQISIISVVENNFAFKDAGYLRNAVENDEYINIIVTKPRN